MLKLCLKKIFLHCQINGLAKTGPTGPVPTCLLGKSFHSDLSDQVLDFLSAMKFMTPGEYWASRAVFLSLHLSLASP